MSATVGQRLVSHYVDTCLERGRPEMVAMKGHVARRVKEMIDLDCDHHRLELAVEAFVERRGRTALQLAEIYAELAQNESSTASERPSARRNATEWIRRNGWPTGARWVRGEVSGTYVYDPLGTEQVPHGYEWPYQRPSFDDVVEALG